MARNVNTETRFASVTHGHDLQGNPIVSYVADQLLWYRTIKHRMLHTSPKNTAPIPPAEYLNFMRFNLPYERALDEPQTHIIIFGDGLNHAGVYVARVHWHNPEKKRSSFLWQVFCYNRFHDSQSFDCTPDTRAFDSFFGTDMRPFYTPTQASAEDLAARVSTRCIYTIPLSIVEKNEDALIVDAVLHPDRKNQHFSVHFTRGSRREHVLTLKQDHGWTSSRLESLVSTAEFSIPPVVCTPHYV